LGWSGIDVGHYIEFPNLWKDADPGIDEIENARERQAGLR